MKSETPQPRTTTIGYGGIGRWDRIGNIKIPMGGARENMRKWSTLSSSGLVLVWEVFARENTHVTSPSLATLLTVMVPLLHCAQV